MTDYRLKPNRRAYFDALYAATLKHRVSPGLVYLYMPELARRLQWGDTQRLWYSFLNGLTQNPITSLVIMRQMPSRPTSEAELNEFEGWFNANWSALQFDVDRQKNKRLTPAAIRSYSNLVDVVGSQTDLLTGTYPELWARMSQVASFGRLSTFSYLEYVKIMGFGADCDDLMFGDLDGSRSHRNGLLMLLGRDELVLDKRMPNGVTGYKNLRALASEMAQYADAYLYDFTQEHPGVPDVSRFTFESVCCAFKNSFFGRRYMGCYSDMAYERILWAEEHGWREEVAIFRDIRLDCLPDWLLIEVTGEGAYKTIKQRAAVFPETGFPFRGEFFLDPQA